MTCCSHFLAVFVILKICGNSSVDSSPDPDAVRFPDSSNFRSILQCPNNEIFCDQINDYPSTVNVDDRLLSNMLIKKKIFDEKLFQNNKNNVRIRISFYQDERACSFRRSVIYPKKARNVKGQFVFIVNDNKYRQAVEIEQCLGEGERCLTDSDAPYSETTVCKQKYATYKLYAITSGRDQVYDSFSLPSACLCHYKPPSSFRSSFGVKIRKSSNLPLCKEGTKLDIENNVNSLQSVTTVKQTEKKLRPILKQLQTQFQLQESRRINKKRNFRQHQNTNKQRRNRRNRNPNIQTQNKGETQRIGVSTDCENPQSTFCQSPTNYPTNLAIRLLANNPEVSGKVFKQVFDGQCTNNIATRSFAIDEDQLCSGTQTVIFPRKAMNMDNKWRFVVNIDNFTQSIEVEECDNSFEFSQGSSDEFGVCLYSGSQGNNPDLTSCKQLYTKHKLLALTEAGQLEVDRFMLPSACACFVKSSFNLQL